MDVFGCYQGDRIPDTSLDVFHSQIGVVIVDDLVKGQPLVEQFENALHRDSCACHTRLTKVDLGIDCYSLHSSVTSKKLVAVIVHCVGKAGNDGCCARLYLPSRPVLQRLGQVSRLDALAPREVRDGPRDPKRTTARSGSDETHVRSVQAAAWRP